MAISFIKIDDNQYLNIKSATNFKIVKTQDFCNERNVEFLENTTADEYCIDISKHVANGDGIIDLNLAYINGFSSQQNAQLILEELITSNQDIFDVRKIPNILQANAASTNVFPELGNILNITSEAELWKDDE